MINKQYFMSAEDIAKFKEVKVSSLYKDYITTIINSPILINIANEHIKNVDITDDIDELISKNSSSSAKKLNDLFKDTLRNLAINMVADSLIIKDIIDVGFADAAEDMEDNFKLKYLLGLADEEHYQRAEKIIEEDPDTSSLIYIGYIEYKKRKDKDQFKDLNIKTISPAAPKKERKSSKKPTTKKTVDISSTDIEI